MGRRENRYIVGKERKVPWMKEGKLWCHGRREGKKVGEGKKGGKRIWKKGGMEGMRDRRREEKRWK